MTRHRTPVVPLEAGAGPDNPPCPACGEPLFGWLDSPPGLEGAVRRCESCGLGVVGEPAGAEAALADLDGVRTGDALRIASRRSWSASLSGAGWAGLEPGPRHVFTPEAVRRLVATRDQVVTRSRWVPAAGIVLMWQTLLNSLTFGRNVALGSLGQGSAVEARRGWQRRLDLVISVLAAVPALVIAIPLELVAAALGRGSVLCITTDLI